MYSTTSSAELVGTDWNHEVIPRQVVHQVVVPPQRKHLGTTYEHFDNHSILPNGDHVNIHKDIRRDIHENIPSSIETVVHDLPPEVRTTPVTRYYKITPPPEIINSTHTDYVTEHHVVNTPVTTQHEVVKTVKVPYTEEITVMVPTKQTITKYRDEQQIEKQLLTTNVPQVVHHTVPVQHTVQHTVQGPASFIATPAM